MHTRAHILIFLSSLTSLNLSLINKNCLKSIVAKEFGQAKELAVLIDDFDDIYIPEIPITLHSTESPINIKSKNIIMYLNRLVGVASIVNKFSSNGNYLLISMDISYNRSTLEELFNGVHQQMSRLIIITQPEDLNTTIYFSQGKNCQSTSISTIEGCTYESPIFKRRLTFNQCSLNIAYLIDAPFVNNISHPTKPGIMVSLFNLIQAVSGISMKYKRDCSSFQHELLTNGSFYQMSEALIKHHVDVALGRIVMNDSSTTPFDFGPVLYNDKAKYVFPTPKKLKSYRKLFVVFSVEIWLKFIYTILAIMVLFYVFSLIEDFKKACIFKVFFDVVRLSIGSGVNLLPKSVALRVLFVFFSLYCISMDSIYLGNLSNIFATSSYDVKVNPLLAAVMRIKYVINWHIERVLLVRYVVRENPRAKTGLTVSNMSMAYLVNHTALSKTNGTILFQSILDTYPSEASLLDYFLMYTDYLTLYVTFYLRKDLAVTESIQYWAQEIVEKGFIIKWFNDIAWGNIRPEILPEEEKKLVVLKLAHFEESFKILLGGYALAFVGFLLEFIFLKLEQVGLVQTVKHFMIFLVCLLKPPERITKTLH